jgi:hypothetical protein
VWVTLVGVLGVVWAQAQASTTDRTMTVRIIA